MGEIPEDIAEIAKDIAMDWAMAECDEPCAEAIAQAILAERQRHTEVIEAAAALLDGTVTMEITLETDEKIQRLSMALHAARHP